MFLAVVPTRDGEDIREGSSVWNHAGKGVERGPETVQGLVKLASADDMFWRIVNRSRQAWARAQPRSHLGTALQCPNFPPIQADMHGTDRIVSLLSSSKHATSQRFPRYILVD